MKKVLLALFAAVLFLTACEPKEILPSGIQLDKQAIALVEGDSYTLKALVNPSDAANKELTWSSSADAVATVDQTGKVVAVGEGTATITATCKAATSVKATCEVTVTKKAIPVTAVDLSEESLTMKPGDTQSVEAVITPKDATDHDVTWTSDNPDVASVDANGVITASKGGVANITATVGGVTSDALVVVVIEPQPMILRYPYCLVRAGNGITQEVWYGTNWKDKDKDNLPVLTWTSSNEAVAVPESGNTFRAIGPGNATMTGVDASGSSISFVMSVEDPADVPYDDYLPGIALVNCHDASAKWYCTKGEYALTDGYVEGTQCMGATANGYKIAEVYFPKRMDVSSIKNPALFIRMYIEDIDKVVKKDSGPHGEPIVEIRSTDKLGEYEETNKRIFWSLTDIFTNMEDATENAKQTLHSGWNNIVLPFDRPTYSYFIEHPDDEDFNIKNLTYFRIHLMYPPFVPADSFQPIEYRFDQIRIIDWTEFDNCDNFKMWRDRPAQQNQYSYKDDTEGKAEGRSCVACEKVLMDGISSYRLEMWPGLEYAMPAVYEPKDLAIAFKFWIDEPEFLVTHFQFNVELASEFTPDDNGFDFAYGNQGDPWPVELKAGWNDLKFNFEDVMGSLKGDNWDPRKITYFRLILTNIDEKKATIKHHTFKIDDIRIVKK